MQGVRKRETERQREMRLASWQHLQQEEAKEPWQNMRFVGADRWRPSYDQFSCIYTCLSTTQNPMCDVHGRSAMHRRVMCLPQSV